MKHDDEPTISSMMEKSNLPVDVKVKVIRLMIEDEPRERFRAPLRLVLKHWERIQDEMVNDILLSPESK